MKQIASKTVLATAIFGLWSMDFAPQYPHLPAVASQAQAVVGRPLTPVSVAGVARRTTRRTVAATSASQQQQAQQQQTQQQEAPQQQAATALPKGTVVSALPAGCTSMTVDGVNLFNCGGTMYQPKFQSNQLVYVVM
jgi:hypothetical protein